jgi:murein DD-endopeptidase MepM/ murein hydrolase activator NlpD
MVIGYPVDDHQISQAFGNDVSQDLIYGEFYKQFDNKHCGVDFPVPVGTEIKSSFPGIVVRSENHPGMGNVLGIRNGNIVALYAHLSNITPCLGEIVPANILIGLSGCTGSACPSPHLHFELRDLTKPTLKEMVFNPPFGEEAQQYKDRFKYVVNNRNTQKTLKKISSMYFGTESEWMLIKQINGLDLAGDALLTEGKILIIPNYTDIK